MGGILNKCFLAAVFSNSNVSALLVIQNTSDFKLAIPYL